MMNFFRVGGEHPKGLWQINWKSERAFQVSGEYLKSRGVFKGRGGGEEIFPGAEVLGVPNS